MAYPKPLDLTLLEAYKKDPESWEPGLASKQAVAIVGYSERTLYKWRKEGGGPPCTPEGNGETNRFRYPLQGLLDFRAEKESGDFHPGFLATPRGELHRAAYFLRPHVIGFIEDLKDEDMWLIPNMQIITGPLEFLLSKPWRNNSDRLKALASVKDKLTALKIDVSHLKSLKVLAKRFWSDTDAYYTLELREELWKGTLIQDAIEALEAEKRHRLALGINR